MQNTVTWKAVHVTYLLSLELQKITLKKGQIISKGLLVSSSYPKKLKNEFMNFFFITMTTNLFVRFMEEFEDTKVLSKLSDL